MDRVTWQQECKKAWAEHEQALKALASAMPSTQTSPSGQFEPIDWRQLLHLKAEADKAWSRIGELLQNRPTT